MNAKNLKIELANSLNYQFNEVLKIVYGHTEGYTSIITPFDSYETTYNIVYCVSKDGNTLTKEEFSTLKAENKLITNIGVNNYRVIITVKGSMKQKEKINNIIEANKIVTNYLKENNYKNIDEYTKELNDTNVCNVKGEVLFITPKTLEQIKSENSTDSVIKKEENVVKGIVGAILGSLVGVLAIVIMGQLGYIAVISGIAMGACTILAYNKLAGGISKKGIIISIIIMIIMTYFAVRLDTTISIYNELSKYAKIDFMQVFNNVSNVIKLDANLESAYMRDMIMTYIFTAIGAFGIIGAKFKEIDNSNVFEVL